MPQKQKNKNADLLPKNLANKRNNIKEPDILNTYIVKSVNETVENSTGTTKMHIGRNNKK